MITVLIDDNPTVHDSLADAVEAFHSAAVTAHHSVEIVGYTRIERDGDNWVITQSPPARSVRHWMQTIRRLSGMGYGTGGGRRNIRKTIGDN